MVTIYANAWFKQFGDNNFNNGMGRVLYLRLGNKIFQFPRKGSSFYQLQMIGINCGLVNVTLIVSTLDKSSVWADRSRGDFDFQVDFLSKFGEFNV